MFFRQAVEHISRAARVFRQPSGHLLLVGVGGSGKKTVVKLASYLEQCDFKALRSSCHYHIGDFRDDVKIAFYNAGIEGNQTVLFINDKNLVKVSSSSLMYIDNMDSLVYFLSPCPAEFIMQGKEIRNN